MNRRKFFKAVSLAAASTALSAPAIAQSAPTIREATYDNYMIRRLRA